MTSSLSSGRWISRCASPHSLECAAAPGGEVYTLNTRPQSWQILRPVKRLNRMPKIEVHEHHRLERRAECLEHLLQRFGLGDVARKAVQDETLGGVRLADALANHAEHRGIVDQLARVHGGLGAQAQFRALGDRLAQQIAGGYLRDPIGLDQQLRLCALAGSGRSQ